MKSKIYQFNVQSLYFLQLFVILSFLKFMSLKVGIGRIAQLGEHSPYKAGVTGSSPVPPTI